MLTAQERKRQIRERRRSLQSQPAAAPPTSAAAKIDSNNPPRNDSDRDSKARKLDNELEEHLDSRTNSYTNGSLSKASTDDATIQLESNLNEEPLLGAKSFTVSSKSLFSAVMKRSFATSDEKKEESADDGGSLLNKVMRASAATTGESHNVTFSASTPTKSPSRRKAFGKANSPGRSPGGYAIKEALDGVSDFTQTFYNMKEDQNEEENNADDGENQEEFRIAKVITRLAPLHLTKNEIQSDAGNTNSLDAIIEETKMANSASMNTSFYHEPIGINVMDWSLKKRVRILCSSGRTPGTFISAFSQERKKYAPPDDGVVQQLAIQYVAKNSYNSALSEEIYGRLPTSEESAMAKWTAATMYYQHPAVHPLPLNVLLESNGNDSSSHNNDLQYVSSFNNRATYQRVRLSGMGCMGGLGMSDKLQKNILETNADKMSSSGITSSIPNLLDTRICEWQEAFKSMYQCWRSKLALLEKRLSSAGRSKPSYDEVSRCCFYSIAPTQIILFRLEWSTDDKVIPVIVLSSTTAEIRSKILCMGAKLKVPRPKKATPDSSSRNSGTDDEFSEEMLNHSPHQFRPESQGEAADLRALREANNSSTDNRPTEVEVTQQKKAQHDTKASSIPPLYVSGDDDCDVVYEILLNTCGFSVNGSYGNWQFRHDVPLLLCRSIGPCLNTLLKKLSVSACRDNMCWNQLSGREGSGDQSSESVMELYGPILPCSLRDLMCASINWESLDQKADENNMFDAPTQPMNGKHNNDSEDKDSSRQVTMFTQAHEGESISAASSTGSSSTCFFNGSISSHSNYEFKTGKFSWIECNQGEGLRSLVWYNSCSTELSYNTFFT